jgi:hypothetical protein
MHTYRIERTRWHLTLRQPSYTTFYHPRLDLISWNNNSCSSEWAQSINVLVSLILTGAERSMIGSLLVSNQWWCCHLETRMYVLHFQLLKLNIQSSHVQLKSPCGSGNFFLNWKILEKARSNNIVWRWPASYMSKDPQLHGHAIVLFGNKWTMEWISYCPT